MTSKTEYLGKGVIVGLVYGIGLFFMAWFKSESFAPFGLVCFLIAYFLHKKSSNKILDEEEEEEEEE